MTTPYGHGARAKAASPSLFERLVVELLLKMGYGGSRQDAGRAIGRSGDEGIDGIINEDRLALDIIYIQAKNSFHDDASPSGCDWRERAKDAGSVRSGATGATEDDGSLRPARTQRRGLHCETSSKRWEASVGRPEVQKFAELMIDHDLGVSPMATYDVKRIDADYFTE